jgi:CheY-like chemotaxis protein
MDHMMPGMDGIEAAGIIRGLGTPPSKFTENYYKTLPIIALTANAMSGMREMFLKQGFNDFISKPIEITKLDELMDKWIRREKRILLEGKIKREVFTGDSGFHIPGIDVVRGINMTGGTEMGYKQVLNSFYKDAEKRLEWFKPFLPQDNPNEDVNIPADTIDTFTSQVHALKSAAGTIGAAALSMEAAQLEEAGKKRDLAYIGQGLPVFYEHLTITAAEIHKSLTQSNLETGETEKIIGLSDPALRDMLSRLRDDINQKNMKEIDRTLEDMEKLPLDSEIHESVTLISDKVLMTEYPEALTLINKLLGV